MRIVFFVFLLTFSANSYAQDSIYLRKTINTLTSKPYFGRGYTKDGMHNAADFIESELTRCKVTPLNRQRYRQEFSYPVNTFPEKIQLKINGKKLHPGKDFIVNPGSIGLVAKGNLDQKDSANFLNTERRFLVTTQQKLTWSVAKEVNDFTQVLIKKSSLKSLPKTFETNIKNQFNPQFNTANICGIVKGTKYPDSLIVLSAHYDHLGGMGAKTFFPGANDNASGVAFLLGMANYYAKNPADYSIVFLFFAGEEAGLMGSKYFTENPLVPLKNIRFLLNLDMIGTGQDGATVVNATIYPKAFAKLTAINQKHYLSKIGARGKAQNSDHYYFTQNNVPAFFLYTQGGITAYHDVDDKAKTLPFTVYSNLFKLVVAFNNSLME